MGFSVSLRSELMVSVKSLTRGYRKSRSFAVAGASKFEEIRDKRMKYKIPTFSLI
jgi:hypothetical protein